MIFGCPPLAAVATEGAMIGRRLLDCGGPGWGPGPRLITLFKAGRWYDAHLLMGKVVILGCGYVGWVLARRLIARGDPVRATTTTEAKLSQLTALGAEPVLLRPDKPESFARTLSDASVVVHLAPPSPREQDPRAMARSIKEA